MTIKNRSFRAQIPVVAKIDGTAAATATNYGAVFIADRKYRVVSAKEVHRTLGTDASAVTLEIGKATGTTADGSASVISLTPFNLKAANATVQSTLMDTGAGANLLAPGDRLCLVDNGTLTAVADVCVTIILEPLE